METFSSSAEQMLARFYWPVTKAKLSHRVSHLLYHMSLSLLAARKKKKRKSTASLAYCIVRTKQYCRHAYHSADNQPDKDQNAL